MKHSVLILVIILLALHGWAGADAGGGGDRCEARFKYVASDIERFIEDGGGKKLDFSLLKEPINPEKYRDRMLAQLSKARISCVGPGDKDYPILVNGKPKECKNLIDENLIPRIICDRAKFYSSPENPDNDPSQYKIVHHEYASLAKIEPPIEDESSYEISNQLEGFIEDKVVKRLVVKDRIRWNKNEMCSWRVKLEAGYVTSRSYLDESGKIVMDHTFEKHQRGIVHNIATLVNRNTNTNLENIDASGNTSYQAPCAQHILLFWQKNISSSDVQNYLLTVYVNDVEVFKRLGGWPDTIGHRNSGFFRIGPSELR